MPGPTKAVSLRSSYDTRNLVFLFALCALPIHLWAVYKAFPDVETIYYFTGVWDAVCYVLYVMLYALVESVVVFAMVLLLSLLGAVRWKKSKLVVITVSLYYIVALGAVVRQLYLDHSAEIQRFYSEFIFYHLPGYSLRVQYLILAVMLALILGSVLGVVVLLDRNKRVFNIASQILDRVYILSMCYLVIDAVGLVVFLLRNLVLG